MKKILFISIFTALFISASCGSNETNTSSINDNENISLKSEINIPSTDTIKETPTKTPLKESLVKKAEKVSESGRKEVIKNLLFLLQEGLLE